MRYREIIEAIENDDDDMFGSSERTKSFRGWTVQQVKDHFDELNDELYGYEAYWEDDDDPEFVRKENELKAMMQYARIRFGEDFYQYLSNWREYSDRQMARYNDRTSADPFNNTRYYEDPRVTKSGKIHKQDQSSRANRIQARLGRHHRPNLPESDESDDDLFGAGGEKMYVVAAPDDEVLGTFQNPEAAVAFAKKQIASYIEDGWGDLDTIKVYKQRLNDLDHGVPIAEFPITDDPLDESDDDDDLFGGSSNHPHGKEIAQELDLWLRRRQSSSRRPIIPSSEKYVQEVIAAFNKSFLKGIETWAEYPLYGNTDVKYDIREYFENSRGVNFMDYVDQVNESEDDDELFASPTKRFSDFFNEYDEDRLQAMGFSYGEDDPETDADIINHYLEDGPVNWRVVKLTGTGDDIVLHLDRSSRLSENDDSDDELFGVSGSSAQRMIYKIGKQMLAKLEQAYNNPHVKAEYEKLTQGEEPDVNRLFEMVCRLTRTPYSQAIVVDAVLREYAGGFSSLNDFGTLIDSGEWQQDIVDTWDMFGQDPDVAEQDWFQREVEYFKWENR